MMISPVMYGNLEYITIHYREVATILRMSYNACEGNVLF